VEAATEATSCETLGVVFLLRVLVATGEVPIMGSWVSLGWKELLLVLMEAGYR
jgi:hypothetical protein